MESEGTSGTPSGARVREGSPVTIIFFSILIKTYDRVCLSSSSRNDRAQLLTFKPASVAASAVSSGRVLKAMDALEAQLRTASMIASKNSKLLGGIRIRRRSQCNRKLKLSAFAQA